MNLVFQALTGLHPGNVNIDDVTYRKMYAVASRPSFAAFGKMPIKIDLIKEMRDSILIACAILTVNNYF